MTASPPGNAQPSRILLGVMGWLGLFVLYEILAGRSSGPEAAVGALASLAATVAVFASGDREHLGRMRWGWWWMVLRRVVPALVGDTIRVLGAAIAPSRPGGRITRVAFEPGGDNPASGSRRALVIAGASVAPNSYVITMGRRERVLVSHDLVPRAASAGRRDPQWPI